MKCITDLRKIPLATLIFRWAGGGALLCFVIGTMIVLWRADVRAGTESAGRYAETVRDLAITAERSASSDPELLRQLPAAPAEIVQPLRALSQHAGPTIAAMALLLGAFFALLLLIYFFESRIGPRFGCGRKQDQDLAEYRRKP